MEMITPVATQHPLMVVTPATPCLRPLASPELDELTEILGSFALPPLGQFEDVEYRGFGRVEVPEAPRLAVSPVPDCLQLEAMEPLELPMAWNLSCTVEPWDPAQGKCDHGADLKGTWSLASTALPMMDCLDDGGCTFAFEDDDNSVASDEEFWHDQWMILPSSNGKGYGGCYGPSDLLAELMASGFNTRTQCMSSLDSRLSESTEDYSQWYKESAPRVQKAECLYIRASN